MFGFLDVRKPAGPTSHDIVDAVRRLVGRQVKVGHAGTLDPFAEGVLVVCLGPACRLANLVQERPKRYRATVLLGATSATDDPEGPVTPTPQAAAPPEGDVRAALARFVGTILQRPPAHSAVHVDGQRAYRLARRGERPDLPPRPVRVDAIELVHYEYPRLEIDVRCGSGTYIRAIARDIGEALGVGGYCLALTRTAVGAFTIERAIPPTELDVRRDTILPQDALDWVPRVALSPGQSNAVLVGKSVELPSPALPGLALALDDAGRAVALGEISPDGGFFRPLRVFPGPE